MKKATESEFYHCDKCQTFVINPEPKECPHCKGKLSNTVSEMVGGMIHVQQSTENVLQEGKTQ